MENENGFLNCVLHRFYTQIWVPQGLQIWSEAGACGFFMNQEAANLEKHPQTFNLYRTSWLRPRHRIFARRLAVVTEFVRNFLQSLYKMPVSSNRPTTASVYIHSVLVKQLKCAVNQAKQVSKCRSTRGMTTLACSLLLLSLVQFVNSDFLFSLIDTQRKTCLLK